jgi:hypothetical protein
MKPERAPGGLDSLMKRLLIIAASGILALPASGQIRSGTIVVLGQSQTRLVIAADSRATFDSGIVNDRKCKIAAFKGAHAIFASTGISGYSMRGMTDRMDSWSTIGEAKIAVTEEQSASEPADAGDAALKLAELWGSHILPRFKQLALRYPQQFQKMAARSGERDERGQTLANGLFAIAYKGHIALAISRISLQGESIFSDANRGECPDLCFIGETAVIDSHRDQRNLFDGPDKMKLAIGLVALTEKEDTSETVGGPIDALELLSDGTIIWKQKKAACAGSED